MIELIPAPQKDFTPKNDLADITRAYQVQFLKMRIKKTFEKPCGC